MSTLLNLPDEILEEIFIENELHEIIFISETCSRFQKIVERSGKIWRQLFFIHFPQIGHQMKIPNDKLPHEFWKQEFVSRYTLGNFFYFFKISIF